MLVGLPESIIGPSPCPWLWLSVALGECGGEQWGSRHYVSSVFDIAVSACVGTGDGSTPLGYLASQLSLVIGLVSEFILYKLVLSL